MVPVLRSPLLACAAAACAWLAVSVAQVVKPGADGDGARLHNGWRVTPAGTHAKTADMLVGCTTSPDGKTVAMVSAGAGAHEVYLLDSATGALKQTAPVERAWNGAAWSPDSSVLYVSGGVSGKVHVLMRQPDGSMKAGEPITIAESGPRGRDGIWLGGLAISQDGKALFAAATATDTIYRLDVEKREVAAQTKVNDGSRPHCLRLASNGETLYVTQWGAASVLAVDPQSLKVRRVIGVGNHPNDLIEVGDRLYVSCGNEDAVAAINPANGQIVEWIVTRLTPRAPAGSTPNALAVSPDARTLYVANADNNSVAVVDIAEPGRSRIRGFIPAGWYPTAVAASRDGLRLFIGSGKGLGTGPNAQITGPIDPVAPKGYPYIVTLLSGMISTVAVPTDGQLAAYSRKVLANSPYGDEVLARPRRAPSPGMSPIPSRVGDASPIKHVLYIIKENRTYDQVLGDLKDAQGRPMGNGDPRLTLFGEDVTPNHHALARDFVTLDNLYCDGEVSVDGHHWSNAAYVPDFMARTWPQQYSGKGSPPLNEALSDTPNGRIWDVCERHGVDYRTYYYHTRKRMSPAWAAARAAGRRDYDYVDIFLSP
ncbi:MAG: hypothetical protein FJX72_05685, partial [Armatimonadetes bacterium]|nr:hypothetical protein [Armatimonadota bacterium]